MKFTICASGNLGLVVLKDLLSHSIPLEMVLTDSKSDGIIELCEESHIPLFKGNPRNGKFTGWLKNTGLRIQHMLSVNYLFILDNEILSKVEGFAINFHGSLLPKYRGRTPHVWAIINGEKECGITAHLMNDKCDDGDIVKQIVLRIEDNDTGALILEKYNSIYPSLVFEIIQSILNGTVTFTPQDITKATYFSKRTPDDGEINWDWQKERIFNWVRAQASPYPGAFTYYREHKMIIHRVSVVDYGFMDTMPNGLILSVKENGSPIIKTPNGTLCVDEYICEETLKAGERLAFLSADSQFVKFESGGVKFVDYTHCDIQQLTDVLRLRNLPEIRQWMVNDDEILFDKHIAFVQSLVLRPQMHYYAVYNEDELCASINIQDVEQGIAERGIYSSPAIQGRGLTSKIEDLLYRHLKARGYIAITAKVKTNNNRSIHYHQKIGYRETHRDSQYIYYQYDL